MYKRFYITRFFFIFHLSTLVLWIMKVRVHFSCATGHQSLNVFRLKSKRLRNQRSRHHCDEWRTCAKSFPGYLKKPTCIPDVYYRIRDGNLDKSVKREPFGPPFFNGRLWETVTYLRILHTCVQIVLTRTKVWPNIRTP